jgi:hypothetical protein
MKRSRGSITRRVTCVPQLRCLLADNLPPTGGPRIGSRRVASPSHGKCAARWLTPLSNGPLAGSQPSRWRSTALGTTVTSPTVRRMAEALFVEIASVGRVRCEA